MHKIEIFTNEEFGQVRTVTIENKLYFVGIDIAKSLGYSNPSKAVIQHCKGITKLGIPSNGGKQETNCIPEGDLYRLITHSELPSAEKFESWVFDEVLPSIRKHGMYATDELLDNPDLLIKIATALKEEREKNNFLEGQVEKQQEIIEKQAPKVTYYDLVLQCKDLLSVTEIAKDYGKSAQWLNTYLKDKKIQFHQSKRWFLYANYADLGYAQSRTNPYTDSQGNIQNKTHLYWTQKGRYFIYETLKADGIVPIIERD